MGRCFCGMEARGGGFARLWTSQDIVLMEITKNKRVVSTVLGSLSIWSAKGVLLKIWCQLLQEINHGIRFLAVPRCRKCTLDRP